MTAAMNIRQVQGLLIALGYDPGVPDGIPGTKTTAAIREFQQDRGLPPDGSPGAETRTRMLQALSAGEFRQETGDFWGKIRYFRREEFRCKCGGKYCGGFPAEPKADMVGIAEQIRAHFGKPAQVVSGLRCREWNRIQGGVSNSQHMYGEACDLRVAGIPGAAVLAYVRQLPGVRYCYQIAGSENIHFDIPAGSR